MNRAFTIGLDELTTRSNKTGVSRSLTLKVVSLIAVLALNLVGCSPTVSEQKASPESAVPTDSQALAGAGPDAQQPLQIQHFSVREESGQTIIALKLTNPVSQFRHFPLMQPSRVVLDIFGNSAVPTDMTAFRVDTSVVATVRFNAAQHSLRMTVDISAPTIPVYTVSPDGGGLRIVIGTVNPKMTTSRDLIFVRDGKRVDSVAAQAKTACPEGLTITPETSEPATVATKYIGEKITLDFRDADIRNIFRLLGEVSGKNLLVTDEVNRKVTLRLKEVPWDQALDLVIETNGLAKEEIGDVTRISTAARIAKEKRELQDARKATQSAEISQLSYLNVNYARVKELADRVKQLIKTGAEIVPDDRSNTLIVRGNKHDISEVICIVAKLDVRTPQILIESNLIETTPSFARALGLELNLTWRALQIQTGFTADPPFQLGRPAIPTIPGSGGTPTVIGTPGVAPLGLQITGERSRLGPFRDVSAILSAAEQEGNIRTISRPSVVTLNNVASTIQSNRILRIALPASTNIASGTGAAAGTAVATERVEVGITLTVTPQVSSDGFINLQIRVKASSLGSQSSGSVIPDELAREANANVLVRDGETIVLGGILKDTSANSETGVPWLRDIPVLGWVFKKVRIQKDFEELMVFITPRLVSAGSTDLPNAEQLWREQLKKTEGDQNLGQSPVP